MHDPQAVVVAGEDGAGVDQASGAQLLQVPANNQQLEANGLYGMSVINQNATHEPDDTLSFNLDSVIWLSGIRTPDI